MKSIGVQRFLFGILKVRLLTCSVINDLFVIKIMYRTCFLFTVTLKLDILENLFFVLFLQISQHSVNDTIYGVVIILISLRERGYAHPKEIPEIVTYNNKWSYKQITCVFL